MTEVRQDATENCPKIADASEVAALREGYLVTVNMQHLYSALHEEEWRNAFFLSPRATLCLDGRGAQRLYQWRFGRRFPRVAGNEALAHSLGKTAGQSVLVIGSTEEIISKISDLYPTTRFDHVGGRFDIATKVEGEALAARILQQQSRPSGLVVVALGVGKQELLAQALADHVAVPIFCIGGSLEMLAGVLRRAPRPVQALGLEALWRLALEPTSGRLKRMVKSYAYFGLFRLGLVDLKRVTG